MANPVLQFLITAKDEASSSLGKIGGALSSLGGLVANVTRSALSLVFPDFGESVTAAENLEIQMGKLRAGIEATGGTAGLTAEEIDAMARRLDEATLGSAEGFRNAAIELLTFKSVGVDSFERTLKAAQDLADAGFGTVESATVQLGKALEDPTKGLTSLTRVGVSFTEEQKNMIDNFVRLGEVAQAQNVILAAVEGQVSGIASAAGGGLAGAVDLVGKRMTDLKETVGGVLTPILTQLNLVWAEVIGSVQKAAAEIAGPLVDGTKAGAGALKALGEGIGQFLGETIRDLGNWIKSLDWQTIQDGASQANAKLTELATGFREFGSVASKIMDGVSISVNAVQVAFNGIVGGVQFLVSGFLSGLATVEAAAAKVGLGSLERANELQARAEEWKQYAADSIADVKSNAAEGVDAFNSLVGATEDATSAQQALKTALPVAELQTLTKTLDDYRGIAERANTASNQAAKDYTAGKISVEEYGAKLLVAAQANQELKTQTEAALTAESKRAAAAKDNTEQLAAGVALFEKNALAAKDYADTTENLVKAQLDGVRAEIALAEAKGDTATAQRLSQQLAVKEAEGAVRVAKAKQAEQEMEYALAIAKRNQTAALVEKNAATQEDLALAELVVQKELAEAQAAGINAQAQEVLLQKLQEIRQLQQDGLQIQRQANEQTRQNTETTEQNTDANEENAKSYTKMENAAVGALRELSGLSAGMEELISMMLHVDSVGRLFGHEFRGELGKLQLQLTQTNQVLEHNAKTISPLVGLGFERMADAANTARKMYLEQAIAATELAGRLNELTENAGSSQKALEDTARSAEGSIQAMRLLDQQTLDRLQSAIDDANDKLRIMQAETLTAKDRLAELNAELLEAQGADQKAQLLRQQLDYQQALAEIEAQRREAELTGNRELLNILAQQETLLNKINQTKIANIKTDTDVAQKPTTTKTTTTSSSATGGLTTAKKYQLDLTAGSQTLSAQTDTDPQSFLDALTRAKRSAA